jgi:EAL domain-containing protein (putative c-di-GMP-specific phosphodiesterase class I)
MVEFAADDPASAAVLDACLGGSPREGSARIRQLRYDRHDQLLRLLSELDRRLPDEHRHRLRCRIRCDSPAGRSGVADASAPDDGRPAPAETCGSDGRAGTGAAAGAAAGLGADPAKPDTSRGDGGDRRTLPEDDEGWQPAIHLFGRIGPYRVCECILHRWFTLYFQPIVQAQGNVFGYELLVRPLPEQPPFRPAELVAVARDSGLHAFLDRELLYKAIRPSNAHLPHRVKRFVNFLPSALYDPAAGLERAFGLIRDGGADPADFVLEIEETERLETNRHLAEIAARCRKRGVQLALDVPEDAIGTGKAAFAALLGVLRPAYLKLGRRWIAGCHRVTGQQGRVRQALALARRHGCRLLAEGVEDAADLACLREMGVPLLQGYLTGPPSPVPVPSLCPPPAPDRH